MDCWRSLRPIAVIRQWGARLRFEYFSQGGPHLLRIGLAFSDQLDGFLAGQVFDDKFQHAEGAVLFVDLLHTALLVVRRVLGGQTLDGTALFGV